MIPFDFQPAKPSFHTGSLARQKVMVLTQFPVSRLYVQVTADSQRRSGKALRSVALKSRQRSSAGCSIPVRGQRLLLTKPVKGLRM